MAPRATAVPRTLRGGCAVLGASGRVAGSAGAALTDRAGLAAMAVAAGAVAMGRGAGVVLVFTASRALLAPGTLGALFLEALLLLGVAQGETAARGTFN